MANCYWIANFVKIVAMKIPRKINEVRRRLMRALTSRVGHSHAATKRSKTIGVNVRRILIARPNARLGNLLLITPLVQDVIAAFPNCKIDLFVKGTVAPVVFRNYQQVDRIIQLPGKPFKNLVQYLWTWASLRKFHYDLVINVDQNSSSGRLSSQFSDADYRIFGETDETIRAKYKDYRHIAKFPVYSFRNYIGLLGFQAKDSPVPTLNLKLTAFEMARGKEALRKLTTRNKKTICIFTYATGDKCYSRAWWETFYARLKKQYGNYNIIEVLPMHNASQIDFKAPSFYSKDIREIGALIANADLFIGADSGMMHLAVSVKTTVVGLFSVSDIEKYQPYGNYSVAIDTNVGDIEDWFKTLADVLAVAGRQHRGDTEAAG